MKMQYVILAVLAAFVWYEFRGSPTVSSVSTPNALGVPTAPPAASVAANSPLLSQAQTGAGLFDNAAGLGNNPAPTSELGNTLAQLQSSPPAPGVFSPEYGILDSDGGAEVDLINSINAGTGL
jgi:hypothetical protein